MAQQETTLSIKSEDLRLLPQNLVVGGPTPTHQPLHSHTETKMCRIGDGNGAREALGGKVLA